MIKVIEVVKVIKVIEVKVISSRDLHRNLRISLPPARLAHLQELVMSKEFEDFSNNNH